MHPFAFALLALAAAACSKAADSAPGAKQTEAVPTRPPTTSAPAPTNAPAATPTSVPAIPCDAAAITALAQHLAKANGLNVDLSDKAIQAEIAAAKATIAGKRVALRGCKFARQGNDEITFGAAGTDAELTCAMQGGDADVEAFRNKAMLLDVDKLRLDVRGEVALGGTQGFERLQLRKCTIDVHE